MRAKKWSASAREWHKEIIKTKYLGLVEVNTKYIIDPKGHNIKKIKFNCSNCNNEIILNRSDWFIHRRKNLYCDDCRKILCNPRGENSPYWNGGGTNPNGYARVIIHPDEPFFEMGEIRKNKSSRLIALHRLVMAQHLGRCLSSEEIVHHKDENKKNNNIENLELTNQSNHRSKHNIENWKRGIFDNLCSKKKRGEDILKAQNAQSL